MNRHLNFQHNGVEPHTALDIGDHEKIQCSLNVDHMWDIQEIIRTTRYCIIDFGLLEWTSSTVAHGSLYNIVRNARVIMGSCTNGAELLQLSEENMLLF
jgi:hypothetical protein